MSNYKWARSLSVIIIVALLLILTSVYFPLGQDLVPFINGSVHATSDIHSIESTDAYNEVEYKYPSQHKELQPDSDDGKVNVIISFKGPPARGIQHQVKFAQRKTLVDNLGGEVKKGFTIINAVSARLPVQAIEALSRRPEISFIEPDHEVTVVSQKTPWGISRIFGSEEYYFPTWDHSTGQGIAIAVLDTGIDKNHVDLPNLLGGVNTIDDTHWGLDSHGHGTHVAGTIAALDNNIGAVGIAPEADLYAVKVMDSNGKGTYSSVIAGIEWAFNNNIPIINMSLGGDSHSEALKDAVDTAYAGGTLLVAAAGNDGNNTDNVLYPARYDSVIAVSASDSQDKLASFSSRGPSVELIAPGSNILSLWPDNYMVHSSGTSMASPHVAGSAAILWDSDTSLSNFEVRQLLRDTAQDLGLPADHQGYGLVRPDLAIAEAIFETDKKVPGSDASIFELTISESALIPEFSHTITEYNIEVKQKLASIIITAILSDHKATMTIGGEPATSNEATTFVLEDHEVETEIDIVVTAEDEITKKYYTIFVNRVTIADCEYSIALYDQETALIHVKDTADAGIADRAFQYGPPNNDWLPVAGDWDGSGSSGLALYQPDEGLFHVKSTSDEGVADRVFAYGPPGNEWLPVAGDWTGDGYFGVALYDQTEGIFHIKDDSSAGVADRAFAYGPPGNDWLPVAGDWTGDGIFGIALYDQSTGLLHVKDSADSGVANRTFQYGPPDNDWLPTAGDWYGSGDFGLALYQPDVGLFHVKDTAEEGVADRVFLYGPPGNDRLPVAGTW